MADQEIRFLPDDFEPVQADSQIHDTKLATKPTTFLKDALRRFRKNKSSVMAAYILAVLILLAIFVPWLSPHNIDQVHSPERFLAPKLFDAGTGFWDGTRSAKHVLYDSVNEIPALSDKNTVASIKKSLVKLTVEPEPTLIDPASPYGVAA